MESIVIKTRERIELIDITEKIISLVDESKIKQGICHVFVPHATAALILQENEHGLKKDIVNKIDELFFRGDYLHDRIDNNAAFHIASRIIGQERSLPIRDSRLVRGTWQNIFFVELDGPRSHREVVISFIKNK